MEARFTARQVWDVRAARALLHAVQKTPLWKIGAACAAFGAVLLALCLALDMKALGWMCFAVLALLGAYAAFALEPMAARNLFKQRRRRWDAAALTFGEEHIEARSELWRCDFRYGSFRRFALCRGALPALLHQRAGRSPLPRKASKAGMRRRFEGFIKEKTGLSLEQPR